VVKETNALDLRQDLVDAGCRGRIIDTDSVLSSKFNTKPAIYVKIVIQ